MRVNTSKCPRCNGKLEKWIGHNLYKCENGHLFALEFESSLRRTKEERVLWVDIIENKEYPVELLNE